MLEFSHSGAMGLVESRTDLDLGPIALIGLIKGPTRSYLCLAELSWASASGNIYKVTR